MIISHLFISVLYRQLLHTFKMCNMWLQCPEFDASSTSLSLPLHPVSHTEPPTISWTCSWTDITWLVFLVAGLQWWLVAGPWTPRRGLSSSSLSSVSQSSTQRWALTCENKLFILLFFFFTPKNSNTKSWWTLFIRSTCRKMCLIGWKSRLQPDDFILYSYFGVFI